MCKFLNFKRLLETWIGVCVHVLQYFSASRFALITLHGGSHSPSVHTPLAVRRCHVEKMGAQ